MSSENCVELGGKNYVEITKLNKLKKEKNNF